MLDSEQQHNSAIRAHEQPGDANGEGVAHVPGSGGHRYGLAAETDHNRESVALG